MKKLSFLFLFVIFLLSFTQFSCNTTGPKPERDVVLKVEDASCTETWLKLTLNNFSGSTQIELKRNGNTVNTFNITTPDTVLYDDSLAPNKTYTYQAVELQNGKETAKSETIVIKTLDATSHNWTFQTFLLGGAQSSVLNDVCIVNDSLAYAVGSIYVNDSTGKTDPNAYNLAKWNGHSWQLLKVQFYTFCGQQSTGSYEANGVFALSNNAIWIASNNSEIAVWNGNKQTSIMCLPVSVSKLWADNRNEIYTVGTLGQIAYYTNGTWQKLESGTDIKLLDVWGNENNTWICGWDDFKPTILLNYKGNSLTTVINNPNGSLFYYNPNAVSGAIESVWTNNPNNLFLLTWYGLYRIENNDFNNPKNIWNGDPNTWGLAKVRGNNVNDIVGAGIYGRIWHYNGVSWRLYNSLINNSDNLNSIAIKGNLIIAVGSRYESGINNYALVQVGHR